MAGARTVPETFNRQDWPRLVALSANDAQRRISALEAGGGGGGGSGTFAIDDGTATAGGGYSFDEGGA